MTSIFSHTNHEVYVITAQDQRPTGFAATWVLPASLLPDYPRLLILASPENHSSQVILKTKKFVIHMLSEHQSDLLPHFGLKSSKDFNKFAEIANDPSEFGPVINETLGYHFCKLVKWYDMGERWILIGDVVGGKVDGNRKPLLKQQALSALPQDILDLLIAKQKEIGKQAEKRFLDFSQEDL